MSIRVDIYHHIDLGLGIPKLIKLITDFKEAVMTTQAELAQQLTDLGVQLGKVSTETSTLIDKIADLEAEIGNASNVTPELQAAFDAVKAQVDIVDALVPDAP